jgi:hypothetical protein
LETQPPRFTSEEVAHPGWRFIPWFLRPNRASAHPAEGVLPLDDEPADENEWFVRFPS